MGERVLKVTQPWAWVEFFCVDYDRSPQSAHKELTEIVTLLCIVVVAFAGGADPVEQVRATVQI
jgi:hypothetical protein